MCVYRAPLFQCEEYSQQIQLKVTGCLNWKKFTWSWELCLKWTVCPFPIPIISGFWVCEKHETFYHHHNHQDSNHQPWNLKSNALPLSQFRDIPLTHVSTSARYLQSLPLPFFFRPVPRSNPGLHRVIPWPQMEPLRLHWKITFLGHKRRKIINIYCPLVTEKSTNPHRQVNLPMPQQASAWTKLIWHSG